MSSNDTKKFKIKDTLVNLFSKTSSKLKTDAVPIDASVDTISEPVPMALSLQHHPTSNGLAPYSFPSAGQIVVTPPNMVQNNLNQIDRSVCVQHVQTMNNFNLNNASNVHFGSVIINSPEPIASRKNSQNESCASDVSVEDVRNDDPASKNEATDVHRKTRKTRSILELMKCGDPVEFETMDIASTHIEKNWKNIFRLLGFSDGEIDQKYLENHHISIKEVVYQLLLAWKQSRDEDATLGKLATILWNNENQQCVCKLKDHIKAKRKQDLSKLNIPTI